LKSNAAELLEQINETHRHVIITQNGEARAVLQDPESFERMRRAIGLLKLFAQGEDDVRVGRTVPQRKVFADLRKKLVRRKS
jgi:prevent-host-death family protein